MSLHIPYPFPFSQRIACHIQIFAMSRWLGVTLPVEYYELARGLQWSIPYLSLPWEIGHVQQVMVDSNPASGSKTCMSRFVDAEEFKITQATQEEENRASQVYGLPLSPMEYETYFEVRKPSIHDLGLPFHSSAKLYGRLGINSPMNDLHAD